MSFTGINNFGNLTLQNGQRLSFKDIKDVDGDGKISKDEFEAFLKENNIDKIELSLVDKNGDGEITEEEYQILEQKQQMQEAVNSMAGQISFDFAGTTLIPEVTEKLKDAISNYENSYNGKIEKMAEKFINDLPELYEGIKNEVLANDPATVKLGIINDIVADFVTEGLSEAAVKTLSKQLESVANTFEKGYKGANLAEDLRAHLEEWLNKADSEKVPEDVANYQTRLASLGTTIEAGELPKLREAAKQLLIAALQNGISVKLGAQSVTTTNINAVLNKYTDGEALKADVQAFIDGLSSLSKKEQILADEATKADSAAEKAFTDIPGSAYAINPSLIDYSNIPGYANNDKYKVKGKSNRENIKNDIGAQIESLKGQIKAQIEKMLESKGIPADKINQVFENAFQESLTQILAGIGTNKTNKKWLNKNKEYESNEGIQTIIQNFITTFNTNIAARVDEMNKTNKDMDLVDIDYTVMAKDETGNVDQTILSKLQNGGSIKTDSSSYATEVPKEMIERLKPQMLQKAMNMCKANGIEFDSKIFTTIFNNAKMSAAAKGVTEEENIFFDTIDYYVDPQKITNIFTTEFKTNYTSWVDAEKAKLANK